MLPNPDFPTTTVLFIDGNDNDRAIYAGGLQRSSADYHIIEATARRGQHTVLDHALLGRPRPLVETPGFR